MKVYTTIIFILLVFTGFGQSIKQPEFLKHQNDPWVDSLMNSLSLEQKIGQLFMIQAYANQKHAKTEEILKQVKEFQVGGVIFMQGGPVMLANINNQLQLSSNIPLLVSIDAENGLGFRLDSTLKYPVQMALGSISDDTLIYRMGYEIGKQCRRIGIHMNMAPVADINVKALNPIINYRSFGEDKIQVARKSWLYASGIQAAGVLATAKHFPGHGDTETDSHYQLPVINQSRGELDSLELFPFSYLINRGIGAVMTGHLQVPALEPNSRIPATLSTRIISQQLKNGMGFKGLIITDAMNMKGVGNPGESAVTAVQALKAGNDMLEIVPRLGQAINAVKEAVQSGKITREEIDLKCRKILALKKWLGLDSFQPIETKNIVADLNKNQYLLTKRLLQEKSITTTVNKNNLLPLQRLDTLHIASLSIGAGEPTPFQQILGNYTLVDHFNISKTPSEDEINQLIAQLKPYNLLLVGIHATGLYPTRRFGITDQQIAITEKLKDFPVVAAYFGNPYALPVLPALKNSQSLIIAYQDDADVQELTAQLIFGAIDGKGKLPVTVQDFYPISTGIEIENIGRLKYSLPEEVGIDAAFLKQKIDSIAWRGIEGKAFPGCQVLIAKEGKVIFQSSYGNFTYETERPVQNDDLYDWASITKIIAPLPALMKLFDEKKMDIEAPFSNYFTEFRNTSKVEFTVKDVLTHQARLQGGLPFWFEPGTRNSLRKGVFKTHPETDFEIRISNEIYARNDFKELIVKDIIKSPLLPQKRYNYSDLGFCLLSPVVERLTSNPFQEYLNKEFYKPLGASSICFKPYEHFPIEKIAPTEIDQTFRKELLQGFVHDELAALMGGVSGNAGLFGTANDLAKVMQMYLQKGHYGGKQFISPTTITEFTKVQPSESTQRRALGFDKPNPGIYGIKNRFPAADASPSSFGHTGFTGTFTWADPEYQLLFIFLSNRVYPTRRNSAIYDLNIRNAMHQAIYEAIKKGTNNY